MLSSREMRSWILSCDSPQMPEIFILGNRTPFQVHFKEAFNCYCCLIMGGMVEGGEEEEFSCLLAGLSVNALVFSFSLLLVCLLISTLIPVAAGANPVCSVFTTSSVHLVPFIFCVPGV